MTTNTSEIKYRTITLTDSPPVRIREDQWPVVAHGGYEDYDNQYRFQANRTTDIDIRVRQNPDGRTIVYGVYKYDTHFQGERGESHRVGVLLDPGADLPAAIRQVGNELIDRLGDHSDDAQHVRTVINGCISDLPAVEL